MMTKTLPNFNVTSHHAFDLPNGETIKFRPFTHAEEKVAQRINQLGTNRDQLETMVKIARDCTFGDVDIEALTTSEYQMLMINIRAQAVGDTTDISIACSNKDCSCRRDITANLTEYKYQEKTFEGEHLDVKIPGSPYTIRLTEPKMASVLKFSASKDDLTKALGPSVVSLFNPDDEDDVFDLLSFKVKDLEAFFGNFTNQQYMALLKIAEQFSKLWYDLEALYEQDSSVCEDCAENGRQGNFPKEARDLSDFLE